MNIALFGGSFDPPHIAHEQIVYKAFEHLSLDKLILVPTYLNPFKKSFLIEPAKRYELLEELFRDIDKVEISDYEIIQHRAVPSIETVKYILDTYSVDTLYLIIGSDNLAKLPLWNQFESLKRLVTFVVISREGYEVKNDIIQFINIQMDIDISSSSLKQTLDLKYIPKKIETKVHNLWIKE